MGAIVGPTTAAAQPPVRAWDDASTRIYIADDRVPNSDPEAYAWTPTITGTLLGAFAVGDVLVLEVKEGSRTLASGRCPIQAGNSAMRDVHVDCHFRELHVDHAGEFVFDWSYEDNQTGERTRLRALGVRVMAHAYLIDRTTRRHTAQFTLGSDDLLGSSVVRIEESSRGIATVEREGQVAHVPYVYGSLAFDFWATTGNTSTINDTALRCTVDGAPLSMPGRRAASLRQQFGESVRDRRSDGETVTETTWGLQLFRLTTELSIVMRGPAEPLPAARPGQRYVGQALPTPDLDVTAHPGLYDCGLFVAGEEARRFRFRVSPDGIEAHAETTGNEGLHLAPDTFFVETYFPASNHFDQFFVADTVRRTGFLGRTWSPAVTAMTSALPRSFGGTGPLPVPGARGASAGAGGGGRGGAARGRH